MLSFGKASSLVFLVLRSSFCLFLRLRFVGRACRRSSSSNISDAAVAISFSEWKDGCRPEDEAMDVVSNDAMRFAVRVVEVWQSHLCEMIDFDALEAQEVLRRDLRCD